MRAAVVHDASLVEFFRGLVNEAFEHQGVRALELTRFYLVQLLADYARTDARPPASPRHDEPLATRLARALDEGGSRQRVELRGLADHALFVAGFFSDSLSRRVADVDYYAALGGYAYQHLSHRESDTFAPAFAELGSRFLAFADVLGEVSERGALTRATDLLRLYERWLRFGTPRHRERLVQRGILPCGSPDGRGRVH